MKLNSSSPSSSSPNSPGKVVRLIEFAPALSLAFLTLCLTFSKGFLSSRVELSSISIGLLTASLLCCVAALLLPRARLPRFENVPLLRIVAREPVLALLLACLIFQWIVLCAWYLAVVPIFGIAAVFIAFALWGASKPKTTSAKILFAALCGVLLLFVLCALAVLFFVPVLPTDVVVFQRDSAFALAHGRNPYALTFPDIYGGNSRLYGPGASVNGVLQFGFPYLPLTLLWVLPAQLLLGDFRYAYILAIVIAAACLWALRKTPVAAASALLLLFSAPTFLVLQHGWTEPLPVMLLCIAAWASRRKKASSFLTMGVLVAAKQYLVLLFPLLVLLPQAKSTAARLADVLKAVAVATFITLPFVLWNPRAFFHSTLFIQIAQPFRDDSLSYLSFFKLVTGTQPPSWPGFLIAIIAIAFCLWRAPRTTTGFVLSVALVMFGFIAFARQAFINYYFLIFGALCCATALANGEDEESEPLKSAEAAAAR
jgi:hypothetical protein